MQVNISDEQRCKHSRFSPMLYSRSFIVFHFPFGSVVPFEMIFLKYVISLNGLIFLQVNVQLFQDHLLKRLSLLHCIAFVPLLKVS